MHCNRCNQKNRCSCNNTSNNLRVMYIGKSITPLSNELNTIQINQYDSVWLVTPYMQLKLDEVPEGGESNLNNVLNTLDPTNLGLTEEQWIELSLENKFQTLINHNGGMIDHDMLLQILATITTTNDLIIDSQRELNDGQLVTLKTEEANPIQVISTLGYAGNTPYQRVVTYRGDQVLSTYWLTNAGTKLTTMPTGWTQGDLQPEQVTYESTVHRGVDEYGTIWDMVITHTITPGSESVKSTKYVNANTVVTEKPNGFVLSGGTGGGGSDTPIIIVNPKNYITFNSTNLPSVTEIELALGITLQNPVLAGDTIFFANPTWSVVNPYAFDPTVVGDWALDIHEVSLCCSTAVPNAFANCSMHRLILTEMVSLSLGNATTAPNTSLFNNSSFNELILSKVTQLGGITLDNDYVNRIINCTLVTLTAPELVYMHQGALTAPRNLKNINAPKLTQIGQTVGTPVYPTIDLEYIYEDEGFVGSFPEVTVVGRKAFYNMNDATIVLEKAKYLFPDSFGLLNTYNFHIEVPTLHELGFTPDAENVFMLQGEYSTEATKTCIIPEYFQTNNDGNEDGDLAMFRDTVTSSVTFVPYNPTDETVFISADQSLPHNYTIANLSSDFTAYASSILWEQIDGDPVTIVNPTSKNTQVSGLQRAKEYTFKVTYNSLYSETTKITVVDIYDFFIERGDIFGSININMSNPLDRFIVQDFKIFNFSQTAKSITPTLYLIKPGGISGVNLTVESDSTTWTITDKGTYFEIVSDSPLEIDGFSYSELILSTLEITSPTVASGSKTVTVHMIAPEDDNLNNQTVQYIVVISN